jgi:hypothetical protein
MKIEMLEFGSITIDGVKYESDVVIDRGRVSVRDNRISRKKRNKYGHTPLTKKESIPWDCSVLIIGTGRDGLLPVTRGMSRESREQNVALKIMPTKDAIRLYESSDPFKTNAILHVTC